jgi:hypothetical protein
VRAHRCAAVRQEEREEHLRASKDVKGHHVVFGLKGKREQMPGLGLKPGIARRGGNMPFFFIFWICKERTKRKER